MAACRHGRWALATFAVAALLLPHLATGADPAPNIPPDGAAGPVRTLAEIRTSAPLGSAVTTNPVLVTRLSCPDCSSATTPADFTITEDGQSLRVHVQNTWQARYNVKKQNNVPEVGQTVVVQGRIESAGGVRFLQMKRFGEAGHEGPTVPAYDVAAGKYPTGTYVWLEPVKVLNVGLWDDGDRTFDVRDPRGGGFVHIELSPPYFGQIRVPAKGETIQPYGMVRFDPDHDFWELHPIRCLNPHECVPLAASYVRNGPPSGTPSSGGWYLQGGPEPLWVPRTGEPDLPPNNGTFAATFAIRNPNEYWQEATLPSSERTVASLSVRVNGASWKTMAKSSWGAWTASTYAPRHATVEFLARDPTGAVALSKPFSWLDGTLAQPSVTANNSTAPPPPATTTTTGTTTTTTTAAATTTTTSATTAPSSGTTTGGTGTNTTSSTTTSASSPPDSTTTTSTTSPTTSATATTSTSTQTSPSTTTSPPASTTTTSPPASTSTSPSSTSSSTNLFRATFKPISGNSWWVQVQVTANAPIRTVEASANSGPWVTLDHASWGDWVKSFYAKGTVKFRAVANDSSMVVSPSYNWPPGG